jgi:hypothetical protein
MQDQLQKAINLVKKTGDKLIVYDSAKPDNTFVIMALKDYENLVLGRSEVRGLTEDELLDKINRDIAIWKDSQELRELAVDQYNFAKDLGDYYQDDNSSNFRENIGNLAAEIIEEDRYYFEPVEG